MVRRTLNDAALQDVVAMALRQRRNRGGWVAAALVVLIGSAVWSHYHNPADPSRWDGRSVVCERVIDGDTIVVSGPGIDHERLRLRGIDAPEVVHPGLDHDAYFGVEARRYLAGRLTGRPVLLKFDGTEKRDPYGRLLGYVYLGDSDCVNVDLVRDGMAYVDRRFKTLLESALDQSETAARTHGVGLWKDLKNADMPEWRQKWLEKRGRHATE